VSGPKPTILYPNMKIAFAFFGITRSLKYTIESIQKNIFAVIKAAGAEYDIFMHTYRLSSYENQRTGEKLSAVNNEEYKLLEPNYLEIHDQDELKRTIQITNYRTKADPWNTNYNSVDNFILGQFSKSRLTTMIHNSKNEYDYLIFIRPDCLYKQPFNTEFLRQANDTTICIPNFHTYGPHKFNDRFCIATMRTYSTYGGVFDKLLEISRRQSLHSETVLAEIMHANKIKMIRIPFLFQRIRCDGSTPDINLRLEN
jgi:hypothetical protein